MNILALAMLLAWQGDDCRSCELLANVASSLSEGNAVRLMTYVDKETPGYDDIASAASALVAQNDVAASIDVLSEKIISSDQASSGRIEIVADWFMQTTSKDGTEKLHRWRKRVKIVEVKTKDGWKIRDIDPRSIVAAP